MKADEAYEYITGKLEFSAARFYGDAEHLSLGRGLIFDGIRYPVLDPDGDRFLTVEGIVYVLTHECDVSLDNARPFNDDILLCPLMPFDLFAAEYEEAYGEQRLRSYLSNLAKKKISRLMYCPRIDNYLQYGGVMFLNQVCSTKVEVFQRDGAERIAALSPVGEHEVYRMLHEHFLRPKDEVLSITLH